MRTALLAGLGGAIAIATLQTLGGLLAVPLLIAPFGASCVLVFGVPASPFAHPRNVIGGYLLGSIPFGVIATKAAGIDIRSIPSLDHLRIQEHLKAELGDDVALDPIVDVGAVVRRALETLQEAGVELVEISGFPLTELLSAFDPILRRELWAIHGARASAQPGHFGPDTLRLVLASRDVTDAEYTAALADRDRLRTQVASLYYDVDALLSPAAPYVAPATTPPIDTEEGELETLFTGPFNVTGDPAIVLPCGYADGLPIGLQLAAACGADQELLRTAATVEAALGFVNPFMAANHAQGSARRAGRTAELEPHCAEATFSAMTRFNRHSRSSSDSPH